MNQNNPLAQQFEANRPHLRAVAYRLLASQSDADDAVQEAWLRLDRSDTREVEDLRAWLTTVVARVALDMLRARAARREESLEGAEIIEDRAPRPEREMELAEAVGTALLVTLERLSPAERLAFVLHDMFGLPFAEIAPIVSCSVVAARQLASRARRRVRGRSTVPSADLERRREVAEAFLKASREGDFAALLQVLAPDVQLRADSAAAPPNGFEVRGARKVAGQALAGRAANARSNKNDSQLALVNGNCGILVAPQGRLQLVLELKIEGDQISEIRVVAEPARLRTLELNIIGGPGDAKMGK